jgi:hypothetical protein
MINKSITLIGFKGYFHLVAIAKFVSGQHNLNEGKRDSVEV